LTSLFLASFLRLHALPPLVHPKQAAEKGPSVRRRRIGALARRCDVRASTPRTGSPLWWVPILQMGTRRAVPRSRATSGPFWAAWAKTGFSASC